MEMKPAKRSDLTSRTNEKIGRLLDSVDNDIRIKIKLGQLLDERGMTQRDLVNITGIGQNMISGFVNNRKGVKIGYAHIFAIMIALKLTDISELMEVELPEDVKESYNKEAEIWKQSKQMPTDVRQWLEEGKK